MQEQVDKALEAGPRPLQSLKEINANRVKAGMKPLSQETFDAARKGQ